MPIRRLGSVLLALSLGACTAPGDGPAGFAELRGEQAAIQTALETGQTLDWTAPDGSLRQVAVLTLDGADARPRCGTYRSSGRVERRCRTAQGFWVHADERFYLQTDQALGFGGTTRSHLDGPRAGREVHTSPGRRGDCLPLHREARLNETEKPAKAREARRAYLRCLREN